jgi:hypothetical protein
MEEDAANTIRDKMSAFIKLLLLDNRNYQKKFAFGEIKNEQRYFLISGSL